MTGVWCLRFSALCWLASLTARKEWLAWSYPLPRCSCTLRLFRFFPWGKGTATYAKLPSFYASIVSFYANPNTDISQWSKQFYLQYRFVMNMYFEAFRFFKQFFWIAILWITSVPWSLSGYNINIQNCQKSPSSRGIPEPMYPGILWKGFATMPNYRRKGFAGWYDESWLTATNFTVPFSCRGLK